MKTVIGLFRDKQEAIATIDDLKKVGAHREDISVLSQENVDDIGGIHLDGVMVPGMGRLAAGGPLTTFLHTGAAESAPDMLVAALVRMGVPRDEATRYVDGVRQGCTLETVSIDDAHAPEALAIMQAHALPADFDRNNLSSSNIGSRSNIGGLNARDDVYDEGISSQSDTLRTGERIDDRSETIPIVEERLDVSKREVEAGGVRVQTHVEEQPVEERIDLREERVDVERRRVDRPVSGGDLFQEKSVELTATAERPIVQKTARVVEEIVLRKDVQQRTETVRDTVRHTEANVQQLGSEAIDDDSIYREHYDRELGGRMGEDDYDYESFKPAYKFGSGMRQDSRFQGSSWDEIEPNARSTWESRNPGTWDRFKMAVKHAWDRAVH